jgi:HlyD family secretion protein
MNRRFILAATFLLAACAARETDTLQGYGEADYLYIAPQDGGVIGAVAVREGDEVAAGAPLFSIDPARLALSAQAAEAQREAAAARVARAGALDQAVAQAQAEAVLADRNLARTSALFEEGYIARARLDADRAAASAARARLRQTRAERDAAGDEVDALAAQSGLAAQRLSDLAVTAPAAGRVERVFRRPGEVAGSGEPVIALLPPANMKVRFFAPEPMLAQLKLGAEVNLSCDGCPSGVTARISRIAEEPQFTPPVIYSLDERAKLVFLVEARPDQPGAIRPGLPVDVTIAP